MSSNMKLWEVDSERIVEIAKTNLDLEQRLEDWIFSLNAAL